MFLLRHTYKNVRQLGTSTRAMSSQGPFVDLTMDNDRVAILTMQRPPVNSLNLDLLREMSKALDEVAKSKAKGMILTSSSSTVFSAGLDIMEMYKPDLKRAEEFWTTLQEVWLKLFGSGFPTAAAINGHAPAGGCLLALSCEHRAMASGAFRMGLNETALGIVAPAWFMDTMRLTVASREAERALTAARMFSVAEALEVGLIDEVASDKADAINKCKDFINKFDKISPVARALTKTKFREGPIARLQRNRQKDTQEFLEFLKNPNIQKSLDVYIQSLKKKSAK